MPLWGIGVRGQLGAAVEWKRFHAQTESRVLFDLLMKPFSGYNIDAQQRLELLYRIRDGKRNRLHVWAGGSLQEDAFFRIIPSLGNASTSTSMFYNLNIESMVQYDFGFIKNGSHNLLTAYGKLILPLGGLVYRPPYAFMDNYTYRSSPLFSFQRDRGAYRLS